MVKSYSKHRQCIISVFVVLGFMLIVTTAPVHAGGTLCGETYSKLSEEWWEWALENDFIPVFDETGADCAVGQSGFIWFLAGTQGGFGPVVTRTCSIPKRKILFFPLVNVAWVKEPGDLETEAEIREILDNEIRNVCKLDCTVDGIPIIFSKQFVRTQSKEFNVTFEEGNVFGLEPGCYST